MRQKIALEEERLRTMKFILTADWLPCDPPGCVSWYSGDHDFRGMEGVFALRRLLKGENRGGKDERCRV